MISWTSPITGSTVTGLTSPTYTFVADLAPDFTGKQIAITALGGTQVGVTTHTASSPFTQTFWRPAVLSAPPQINPITGLFKSRPKNNVYRLLTRKGVTPALNQLVSTELIRTELSIPAGAETYDTPNVRAAIAAHIGLLNQISAGLSDTAVTGIT